MGTGHGEARHRSVIARHKVLVSLGVVLCLLAAAVAGWGYYLNHRIDEVPRVALHIPESGRPPPAQPASHGGGSGTSQHAGSSASTPLPDAGRPLNILLAGLDNPKAPPIAEALQSGTWQPGVYRSDTIIVAHITADRQHMYLISIPRDSWVNVPGYGMHKINAAFSYGGPSLYVQTVEQFTGLRMDHLAVIGWNGFKELSSALGGVRVYIPRTVYDSANHKTWHKGYHTLQGQQALLYVRQRHGLPGGGFSRIQRQENFLRAMMKKLLSRGTLANPLKLTNALQALTDHLVLDAGFSTSEVRGLALSLRGISASDVTFLTIPVKGTGWVDGKSVVQVAPRQDRALFHAVRAHRLPGYLATHNADLVPSPQDVQ